jgi:DNA end-binding protein Ku
MPRAIWTGAISFGLVNVPVKLYSAISQKTVRFNQLHERDGVRIQLKRICPADGEEVPFEHIVKGYEITPGEYVVVSKEELEALEPPKTKTIEIEEFIDAGEIDPIYYDRSYYLLPDRVGQKPYRLLVAAMEQAGKVAIGRVTIRTKEQLVAIRPTGDMLTMATMNYADEVVASTDLEARPADEVKTAERERDMARQLVDSLTSDFEPDKFHDTYRERVLELIAQKAEGKEVALAPATERAPAPDLMAALEASVEAVQRDRQPARGRKRGAKKEAAPARRPRAGTRR